MTETLAWLSAWRGTNLERAAVNDERGRAEAQARAVIATEAAVRQRSVPTKPVVPRGYKRPKPAVPHAQHMTGFQEPEPWTFDGCKRREPVLDRDFRPARVVRVVGWKLCLRCQRPFFSPDVRGMRMCPGKTGVSE